MEGDSHKITVRRIRKHQARLALLLALALAVGIVSIPVAAYASPTASIAKKCKKGKACKKSKPRLSFTNCPSADLTPGVPYTFEGRLVPARSGVVVVIRYFDQGTLPVARHVVKTMANGRFSDSFAYQATGVRRGGTVRASLGSGVEVVCEVTIAEM
jgi:hypothetical protein